MTCRHKFSVWAWNMWNTYDAGFIIFFLVGMTLRLRAGSMDVGRVIYCVDIIYWYLRILNILGVNKYLGKEFLLIYLQTMVHTIPNKIHPSLCGLCPANSNIKGPLNSLLKEHCQLCKCIQANKYSCKLFSSIFLIRIAEVCNTLPASESIIWVPSKQKWTGIFKTHHCCPSHMIVVKCKPNNNKKIN